MKTTLLALAMMLVMGIASACGDPAEASGPPEINYGRDICIECNMIISEPRFAAAYRLDDGEAKAFDGVGELVKHAQRMGEFERIMFAWAHDYHTEDWVLVEDAHFVAGREIVTPMGHGIVAFTTMADAKAFAAEYGGAVMGWEEVAALPVSEEGLLGHHHDEDGHDEHMDDDTMDQSSHAEGHESHDH